jgi:acyl carrier protein phosphodiesterase
VVVDVFYDHFLAKEWDRFSEESLENYTRRIYNFLQQNTTSFPERSKQMLPFMITHDWLMAYRETEGIRRVLTGMSRRTKFDSGMEKAADDLEKNYELFSRDFEDFFPDVIGFAKDFREKEGQ